MARKTSAILILGLTTLLTGALAAQQKPEDIPDAPSATRPIPPPEPPSPRAEAEEESKPDALPPDGSGVTSGSKELPHSAPDSTAPKTDDKPAPASMPPITTAPSGNGPRDLDTGEDLYKIRVNTTLVLVPVTVKDSEGRLVGGLRPQRLLGFGKRPDPNIEVFHSRPICAFSSGDLRYRHGRRRVEESTGDAISIAGSV